MRCVHVSRCKYWMCGRLCFASLSNAFPAQCFPPNTRVRTHTHTHTVMPPHTPNPTPPTPPNTPPPFAVAGPPAAAHRAAPHQHPPHPELPAPAPGGLGGAGPGAAGTPHARAAHGCLGRAAPSAGGRCVRACMCVIRWLACARMCVIRWQACPCDTCARRWQASGYTGGGACVQQLHPNTALRCAPLRPWTPASSSTL